MFSLPSSRRAKTEALAGAAAGRRLDPRLSSLATAARRLRLLKSPNAAQALSKRDPQHRLVGLLAQIESLPNFGESGRRRRQELVEQTGDR